MLLYIPAKRNNGQILVDSSKFHYNLAKKSATKTWWICSMKASIGFKVTATVLKNQDEDDIITKVRGQHDHDTDLMKKAASRQGSRMLAPLAPPVPDKPHLVGQNEI